MNPRRMAMLVSVSVGMAACGSPTDANERNFGAALQQYFHKHGELCVGLHDWPVDVPTGIGAQTRGWGGEAAARMSALEAAGLVKVEDAEVNGQGLAAATKLKVRRYTLTEAAKPFTREPKRRSAALGAAQHTAPADLCWGKKSLDKVVKWEGPMTLGAYQEALVVYTYEVEGIAGWAQRPDVQAAFASVKETMEGARDRHGKHGVKLTSAGWEAKGLE